MNVNASLHSEPEPVGRDKVWLGVGLLLVALMLVGLGLAPQRISSEAALGLQQAQLLLEGAIPYCDFVDVNTPLIVYLDLLPAWLGRMFGLSPIPIFNGLVVALVVVSGLELYYLLRLRRMGLPGAGRGLLLLTWIASYFVVDWRGDVGQREHLFILFYTPYLFLRILRYRGGSVPARLAVWLGVQAGIGLGLQPLFLLVAVNVELVMLFTLRARRTLLKPEIFAVLLVVSGVFAHWLIVPAAMREAYFSRWLPLIRYGSSAYDATFERVAQTVLQSPIALAAAAAALAAMMVCRRRRARLRQHLITLAALAGMALVLVFLQKKGWSSHRVPLNVAGLLCLAVLIVEGVGHWAAGRRWPSLGARHWILGGLVLGAVLLIWFVARCSVLGDRPEVAALRDILQTHSQPGDRVLMVGPSTAPAYPLLVQTGRRPASRYLYAFPIACLYVDSPAAKPKRFLYRAQKDAPIEERQFLEELEDDAVRRQPRLIFVENRSDSMGLPGGFNVFDYLVSTGWVRKVLGPYRELSGPEGWMVFERGPEK